MVLSLAQEQNGRG